MDGSRPQTFDEGIASELLESCIRYDEKIQKMVSSVKMNRMKCARVSSRVFSNLKRIRTMPLEELGHKTSELQIFLNAIRSAHNLIEFYRKRTPQQCVTSHGTAKEIFEEATMRIRSASEALVPLIKSSKALLVLKKERDKVDRKDHEVDRKEMQEEYDRPSNRESEVIKQIAVDEGDQGQSPEFVRRLISHIVSVDLPSWHIDTRELKASKRNTNSVPNLSVSSYLARYRGSSVYARELQQVDEDTLERLGSALNKMYRFRHPNIARTIGGAITKISTDRRKRQPYGCIVTEYLADGLDKIDRQNLTLVRLRKMAMEIARAMSYLHSGQPPVLHLGIKPSNIRFDEKGSVKIVDFCLGRVAESINPASDTPVCDGAFRWMAPEQRSVDTISAKSDVYSFGLILWHLLTGEMPHPQSKGELEALYSLSQDLWQPHFDEHDPDIDLNSIDLQELAMSCLSKDVDERPSFVEIMGHLQAHGLQDKHMLTTAANLVAKPDAFFRLKQAKEEMAFTLNHLAKFMATRDRKGQPVDFSDPLMKTLSLLYERFNAPRHVVNDTFYENRDLCITSIELLNCQRRHNPSIVCSILLFIKLIARSPANQLYIAEVGGLPALVGVIEESLQEHKVVETACLALLSLLVNNDNRCKVGEGDLIPRLMRALSSVGDVARLVTHACWVLMSLAYENVANGIRVAESGGVKLAIDAIKSHTNVDAVVHHACGALANLAAIDENKVQIGGEGAIPVILSAIKAHMENEEIVRCGCRAIENLSEVKVNRNKIRHSGGITLMQQLSQSHKTADAVHVSAQTILKRAK